jgi:NAD-dependent SIR2 family protein deacetylase
MHKFADEELVASLKAHKKILFLTGTGISADSGIPT